MNNEGLQLYLREAEKHKKQYVLELNELRADLVNNQFKSRDYRATERLLQIFTEMCIGLAKHWLKKIQGNSANEAYQTFMALKEQNVITSEELQLWKKIVGMRNGLVHDYLNIDLLIVENIIREEQFIALDDFAIKVISALKSK